MALPLLIYVTQECNLLKQSVDLRECVFFVSNVISIRLTRVSARHLATRPRLKIIII